MKITLKNVIDPFNPEIEPRMTLTVESVDRITGEVILETNCNNKISDATKARLLASYKTKEVL